MVHTTGLSCRRIQIVHCWIVMFICRCARNFNLFKIPVNKLRIKSWDFRYNLNGKFTTKPILFNLNQNNKHTAECFSGDFARSGEWFCVLWLRDGTSVGDRLGDERLGDDRLAGERLGDERLAGERLGDERLGGERLGDDRLGGVCLERFGERDRYRCVERSRLYRDVLASSRRLRRGDLLRLRDRFNDGFLCSSGVALRRLFGGFGDSERLSN